MGKKGKNKNQAANIQNTPKLESENIENEEKNNKTLMDTPKMKQLEAETEKNETLNEEVNESKEGTLKSKRRRNRKKKKDTSIEINNEEPNGEKNQKNANQKEELQITNQAKSEPSEEKAKVELSTDTLKKKRRRNKKKNVGIVDEIQEENVKETSKNENPVEISGEKLGEDPISSQQNTLKRKRNRNKNKTRVNNEQNESIIEVVKKSTEKELQQLIETKCEQKEKPEQLRRNKKQKRFDLTSKKTILDELQERQEREQKVARDHIKNEIAKREKLLETIDLVLDCHKNEAELAKNQQESLKDVKLLSQEASKPSPQPLISKCHKQSSNKKPTPVEEELVNKIEQVLGMTKLEIQNAHTQQAYVNRLETEVAKVKQSKDILLGSQPSSVVPPHIQKMAKDMRDISKGEVPKTKEELIKEIESRDALMSEINRVLDNTKSEINKVQKQQQIIQNLEVELSKMKEQEIVEKLMALEEDEPQQLPPPPKQSPATASLLDALMANVGKLKDIQAMKEKQKSEQAIIEVSGETVAQEISEIMQKPVKLDDEEPNKIKESDDQKQEMEKLKCVQEDTQNTLNEKKLESTENSPNEQKKHPKDQKKQPQKEYETKPKAEITNSKNNEIEISTKIDSIEEMSIVDAKLELEKQENFDSPKNEKKKDDHNVDEKRVVTEVEKRKQAEITLTKEKSAEIAKPQNHKVQKSEVRDKEIIMSDLKKVESLECNSDKNIMDDKQVVKNEITSIISYAGSQEFSESENNNNLNLKENDQKKKKDGERKNSPKSSHKNKNHKSEMKAVLKGVPDVNLQITIAGQKPSMAEMLKSAPDPPPDEINKKQNEEKRFEAAPLARPESVIMEAKPSEQIKGSMEQIMKETIEAKNTKEVSKDSDDSSKVEPEVQDDEIVIVEKVEVEAEIKEEKSNEQELTVPKNVQRGGFVSLADTKDAKPLKKNENIHVIKNKSPVKAPSKSMLIKGSDGKLSQNAIIDQKAKLEVQAKVNSKMIDTKKTSQSTIKLSVTTEKPKLNFENADGDSKDASASLKIEIQKPSHEISSPSTDKPKIPPRPDVTKSNNTKPAPKAGNVTNQSSSPIKTKTSSSKSSVTKSATTSTAQSQSHAGKPKPTVSQTRQLATSKSPINTKITNQKPLATTQKVNSTKTATPKSSSLMASASEIK